MKHLATEPFGSAESLQRIVSAHLKRAWDEVDVSELPQPQQDLVLLVLKSTPVLPSTVGDGLHGYTANFTGSGTVTTALLRSFLQSPIFRWLSIDEASAQAQLPTKPLFAGGNSKPLLGGSAGAGSWRLDKQDLQRWTKIDAQRKLKFKELSLGI